jgi:hypothetical protein
MITLNHVAYRHFGLMMGSRSNDVSLFALSNFLDFSEFLESS